MKQKVWKQDRFWILAGLFFVMVIVAMAMVMVVGIGVGAVSALARESGPNEEEAGLPPILPIAKGELKVVAGLAVSRVAIGDPELVDVKLISPNEILLNAKQEGVTSLIVWDEKGRHERQVRVVASPPGFSVEEVKAAIAWPGVEIRVAGAYLVLEGQVDDEQQSQAVERAAKMYTSRVINMLMIRNSGWTDRLTSNMQAQVSVKIVEMDKTALREAGLSWNNGLSFGEAEAPVVFGLGEFKRLEALFIQLRALERSGKARILAEPKLVTISGERASFLAGGEIPVLVGNQGQMSVEWKEYGVKLSVEPRVLPEGNIVVQVRPEVSTLDWSNGVTVDGKMLPSIKSRWAETSVRLKDGATLLIAGLIQNDEAQKVEQVPFLSHLPVIGEIFKSTRFANNDTELVIFVTTNILQDQAVKEGLDLACN